MGTIAKKTTRKGFCYIRRLSPISAFLKNCAWTECSVEIDTEVVYQELAKVTRVYEANIR